MVGTASDPVSDVGRGRALHIADRAEDGMRMTADVRKGDVAIPQHDEDQQEEWQRQERAPEN